MHGFLLLTDVPIGSRAQIRHINSRPEDCLRLRELGFCENAVIRCINKGSGNIICEVCNTRVGINLMVANSIFVSSFSE